MSLAASFSLQNGGNHHAVNRTRIVYHKPDGTDRGYHTQANWDGVSIISLGLSIFGWGRAAGGLSARVNSVTIHVQFNQRHGSPFALPFAPVAMDF